MIRYFIKSLNRHVNHNWKGHKKPLKGKNLRKILNGSGYYYVTLCKFGTTTRFVLHRLVGINFIPNPENKPQINHKDGNKLNNYYKNLEWCTQSENNKHALRTGLRKPLRGSELKISKLNELNIFEIRKLLRQKISISKIAKIFNVNFMTIHNIKSKRTWAWLK